MGERYPWLRANKRSVEFKISGDKENLQFVQKGSCGDILQSKKICE